MKIKKQKIFYINADRYLETNKDSIENNKENKDILSNISSQTKKFLFPKNNEFLSFRKFKKNGKEGYVFEQKKRDTETKKLYVENKVFLSNEDIKELDKDINTFNGLDRIFATGLNIGDIISSFTDDMDKNEENISYSLGNLGNVLANLQEDGIFSKLILEGNLNENIFGIKGNDLKGSLHGLLYSMLYTINYNYTDTSDIVNMIKIYDNNIKEIEKKGIKLSSDNLLSLFGNLMSDIVDDCNNLSFYKKKGFIDLLTRLKIKKISTKKQKTIDEKMVDLGQYNRKFNLEDFDFDVIEKDNNILDNYRYGLDLNEYDFSFLSDRLKKNNQKISINELITLSLYIDGKNDKIDKSMDLNKIIKKLGYDKLEDFKKEFYNRQYEGSISNILGNNSFNILGNNSFNILGNNSFNILGNNSLKGTILDINNELDLNLDYKFDSKLNIFFNENKKIPTKFDSKLNISFSENKKIPVIFDDLLIESFDVSTYISFKSDVKTLIETNDNGFKKYAKENILSQLASINDSEKRKDILDGLNKILKENNKKEITEKDIENKAKQEADRVRYFIENIKPVDEKYIENMINTISENFLVQDKEGLKESIKNFFNKENLEKLKNKFAKTDKPLLKFVADNFFEENKDKLKIKTKDKKVLEDKDKIKIASILQKGFLDDTKFKKQKEIEKMENEVFGKQLEKVANTILDIENVSILKKKLIVGLLKDDISEVILKYNITNLTKESLSLHKEEILQKIKKQLGIAGKIKKYDKKLKGVEKYGALMIDILDNFIMQIPKKGYNIDKKYVENIKSYDNVIKKLENDLNIYKEKGYEGYISYYEKIENEKKLLKNGPQSSYVDISQTPFKDRGNGLQTAHEEIGGIHIVYMKLPGKDKVLKVESLTMEDANKELISAYLGSSFNLPIRFKGSGDSFNKLVSDKTDVNKDVVTKEDFSEIMLKFQVMTYNNFFGGGNKEKNFLKENKINNPYELFKEPVEYGRKFAQALLKEGSLGGLNFDINSYLVDLDREFQNHDYNMGYCRKIKNEILKNGDKASKGVFASIGNYVKTIFS